MPYHFTSQCAGDIGVVVTDVDKPDYEYMTAIMFFRAKGGYPVFDVYAGGEPLVCDTLPEALNHMVHLARTHLMREGIAP